MARILKRGKPGTPGFTTRSVEAYTGQKVPADRVSVGNVRRLFARNPRKGAFLNFGTKRDVISVLKGVAAKQATLTTALAGANNDLKYASKAESPAANAIQIAYVVAGLNTALSVGVAGNVITVNVATNGAGAATSTADQVRTAVKASAPAMALLDSVEFATGNDGTGVVTAMAATNLAGGANAVTTEAEVPNTVAAPNPRIINGGAALRSSVTTLTVGAKRVTRAANRKLTKR